MSQVQESHPTVMPVMVDDPVNAININNIHRSSGVGDLWTLTEWVTNYSYMTDSDRYYKFPVPTVVPDMWLYGANKPPSQVDYSAEFDELYPIVYAILPIPNVSVCGGAAAPPLISEAYNIEYGRFTNWLDSDVDMFFFMVLTRPMKKHCGQPRTQLHPSCEHNSLRPRLFTVMKS